MKFVCHMKADKWQAMNFDVCELEEDSSIEAPRKQIRRGKSAREMNERKSGFHLAKEKYQAFLSDRSAKRACKVLNEYRERNASKRGSNVASLKCTLGLF